MDGDGVHGKVIADFLRRHFNKHHLLHFFSNCGFLHLGYFYAFGCGFAGCLGDHFEDLLDGFLKLTLVSLEVVDDFILEVDELKLNRVDVLKILRIRHVLFLGRGLYLTEILRLLF